MNAAQGHFPAMQKLSVSILLVPTLAYVQQDT